MGICHSYTPDGRCISLLKVLLTNVCQFDCHYCINRRSSDTPRARFTPDEVVRLTLDFYKRNLIEGLFLSSGIVGSPDRTMEQVVEVARRLREEHDFRGYLHLKTIPEASPELIERAGRYADRISLNLELPSQTSLDRLAPEKNLARTKQAMTGIRRRIDETRDAARAARQVRDRPRARPPAFATGQSTQLIVGADDSSDALVLGRADEFYRDCRLRRVYYSAYSPIPDACSLLPPTAPPLVREHRLYQADWLIRFYGFDVTEILEGGEAGMLDLALDPKLAWALKHRARFPVDLNRAPREALLRVPGLGKKAVERILSARRHATLRLPDLARLRVPIAKAAPFLAAPGHVARGLDDASLRHAMTPATGFARAVQPALPFA
jgi:putative DNA modification/repair radical SAM protein